MSYAFRIGWRHHTREAGETRNVGFQCTNVVAVHLTYCYGYEGGAGRKVSAGFGNLDNVYKMARFVWGTSR